MNGDSASPPPAQGTTSPTLAAEEGWTALSGILPPGAGAKFVSRDPAGDRLRVAYFRRERDNALMAKVWFGPGCEGPPAHAHGGSMAAVLDEAMGFSCWISGHAVLAAKITVEFKQLLPLGSEVLLEAWVDRADGRKVHARAHLLDPTGKPYSRAEGLFITLGTERFGELRNRAAKV